MEIIQMITNYGLDTVAIAISTVIVTGILKIPIKVLSKRLNDSKKLTRFITFLPIIIGFGLTVLSVYIINRKVVFEQSFYTQWLSSVSLSLAIYAIWEKFIPSKKKILSESEIVANQELIEELRRKLTDIQNASEESLDTEITDEIVEQTEDEATKNQRKIILTNNKNK